MNILTGTGTAAMPIQIDPNYTLDQLFQIQIMITEEIQRRYVAISTQPTTPTNEPSTPPEEWISVQRARALAEQEGDEINSGTILTACKRGVIKDAEQRGHYWYMTETAFRDWQKNRIKHKN